MTTRPFALSLPAILFAMAIGSSLIVFWSAVLPMVDGRGWPRHRDHLGILLTHIGGGVSMVTCGSAALYLGWNGLLLPWHRWAGRIYLVSGTAASLLILSVAFLAPHEPQSLFIATGTLAAAWLAVAAMGWRAARNRRFASHREWMIRSYVLTWTFVGCRLASDVDLYPWLGDEGITAAIWVNWVVPLI